ncbi:MAG: alpha/beta fold hydrolase [Acidimicrobiales bacterium]
MPYRTSTFRFGGHDLVYDDYGDPSTDQVLVYIHGLLLDSEINRGIAQALSDHGHRVVLLDLLGHGRSDKPTHASEYRIDTFAEQVVALLDVLEVPAAVVGGMSLGANVSLFAASHRPERVRGLVLEMPVLEWAVPSAAMLFAPMVLLVHYGRPLAARMADLARRVPTTRMSALNSFLHAASLPPETMAAVLHGILVGPVAPTIEERSAIEAPALILGHRYDLIHPFDDATNLAAQLPNARLERARSPVELRLRPARLTDGIDAFLDDVWAGDGQVDAPVPSPTVAEDGHGAR